MDDFIKYIRHELIAHNILAALYAGGCLGVLVMGLQIGLPWGALVELVSGYMGYVAFYEAKKSLSAAKILDQARAQQQEESSCQK